MSWGLWGTLSLKPLSKPVSLLGCLGGGLKKSIGKICRKLVDNNWVCQQQSRTPRLGQSGRNQRESHSFKKGRVPKLTKKSPERMNTFLASTNIHSIIPPKVTEHSVDVRSWAGSKRIHRVRAVAGAARPN